MRIGLFSLCKGRSGESTLAEISSLIQHAEAIGFSEAWLAGTSFVSDNTGPIFPSAFSTLFNCTSHIRLGAASLFLPSYKPGTVIEEVALLDRLSGGRFDMAVTTNLEPADGDKGIIGQAWDNRGFFRGAFPSQCRHAQARTRSLEALTFIRHVLTEEIADLSGRFFWTEGPAIAQRSHEPSIWTGIGSNEFNSLKIASALGCGLMMEPVTPSQRLPEIARFVRNLTLSPTTNLLLIRYFYIGRTHDQAIEEAAHFLAPAFERTHSTPGRRHPSHLWFELGQLIADQLIGTIEDVRAKVLDIERRGGPVCLLLVPVSPVIGKTKDDISLFAREILPDLAAAG